MKSSFVFKPLCMSWFFVLVFSPLMAKKYDRITMTMPTVAPIGYAMLKMKEDGALDRIAKEVKIIFWNNPDMLRSMVVKGQVDFAATPSNVGANLYNKGVEVKLINLSIWGILYILSRDKTITDFASLKGKEIVIPFKGDMPEIVFNNLVKKQGYTPRRDFKITYTSNPMNALQLVFSKKADTVILPESVASVALLKDKSLNRGINIQQEWRAVFNQDLAQAGIITVGKISRDKKAIDTFNKAYKAAINWMRKNPKPTGELVHKYIKKLQPKAVANAIPHTQLAFKRGKAARAEAEQFFKVLKSTDPKKIGGRLPDSQFYY